MQRCHRGCTSARITSGQNESHQPEQKYSLVRLEEDNNVESKEEDNPRSLVLPVTCVCQRGQLQGHIPVLLAHHTALRKRARS